MNTSLAERISYPVAPGESSQAMRQAVIVLMILAAAYGLYTVSQARGRA